MASNTQEFKTVVSLNAKQAQDELLKLKKQVEDLKKKKDEALKGNGSWSKQDAKDLKQATAAAKVYESTVSKTISTLSNMGTASAGEVKAAMRQLKKVMDNTTDPKDYQKLEEFLEQCKFRISGMTDATKLTAKEMRELMNNSQLVAKVLGNINTSSLKDLAAARDAIQKSMNSTDPSSWKYKSQGENLKKVQNRIAQIKAEQQQINSLVDQYDIELRSCQKSTAEINKESQMIGQTMNNLTKSSIRELEMAKDLVEQRLKYTRQDSDEFKTLTRQARQLNNQLEITNNKSKDTRGIWSKISGFFNTNWGFFTQAIGALTGLTVTIRKATTAYAEMEDTMASVRKYTNQTDEQVRSMNEDFKKMDTRTSREQLNELAGAAGRLGKQSTKDIEDFVEAADKINVALGDDLGKGAVDKIGKLANVFGEEGRLGLKQAMLSTGSAINELAQSSSANAGYIVDFTADLAGVGRQAGMTQAQIMGLASALDQNMQEEATASTVFSQLITKMYQDPAKFANIAGIEVGKFTKLLKEDANRTLLEFMQSMQNKGGFAEMAPMFESMNLDGTRAVGVLSSVATHLNQVRVAQDTATKAYEAGTSVLTEFNTNNETINAELDKAKKKFNDLTIELGQKLLPVAKVGISSGSMLVNVLSVLASVVIKAGATVATLTATIIAYTVAVNMSVIKTRLLAFWNDKVVASFKKVAEIVKANPYMAVAAAIALLTAAVMDYIRQQNSMTRAQKEMNKVQDQAAEKAAEESSRLENLRKIVNDNTKSVEERKAAILEIKKVMPNYIATINGEGNAYKRNTELLNSYIQKLKEKAIVEGAKEEMRSLGKEIAHTTVEIAKQEAAIRKRRKEAAEALKTKPQTTQGATAPMGVQGQASASMEILGMQAKLKNLKNDAREATDALKTLQENFGKQIAQSDLSSSTRGDGNGGSSGGGAPVGTGGGNGHTGSGEAEDHNRIIAEKLKTDYETAQLEENYAYAKGEVSYREHLKKLDELQLEYINNRKARFGKDSEEYGQACIDEINYEIDKIGKKKDLDEKEIEMERRATAVRLQQTIHNESDLNEALYMNDLSALSDRLALYKEGSEEYESISLEIEEMEQQHQMEHEKHYSELLSQYREQWGRKDAKEQERIAINGLDTLHEKGIIKEQEYQEMLHNIKLHYAEEESQNNLNNSKGEQFKRNADTAYQSASNNAKADYENDHPTGTGVGGYYTSDVTIYASTLANIKKMEQQGVVSHQEAMAAMSQTTSDMCQGMAAKMQAAYDAISPIMSAMSSYYSAQSDYEVTVTEKKYDKMIEKAGNNSAKSKKLEEKKQKEVAKIKTKYAKKQMKMEIAQAIAQTAMSAIAAYGSAMSGAPYPANLVLAPIAAGIALAAGAIQIATIKKQQAQEAGYYEGGFTGGNRYRREAGVVHEGEFVANHNAVNNPQLLPALRLIDVAQRNNTVGRLTAADVSRAMGTGGATVVSAPTVNVQTDNSELAGTLQQARDTIYSLGALLASGQIIVKMPDWDDFDRSRDHWEKIKGNK